MSKNLLAVSAFSLLFLAFTPVSYAQEDSKGIVPIDENNPLTTQPLQEEPVQTRDERIRGQRDREMIAYGSAKMRYISVLQNPVNDTTDSYKLGVILVSARYHKLTDLYYSYLLKIDKSFADTASGFDVVGPDDELNQIEQKIILVSRALDDFDFTIDTITGITETELQQVTPELLDKSSRIKLQLEEIKTDLSGLVETIE